MTVHLTTNRSGRFVVVPGPPPHGTRARYVSRSHSCRCDECRAANAQYHAEYRQRRRWQR